MDIRFRIEGPATVIVPSEMNTEVAIERLGIRNFPGAVKPVHKRVLNVFNLVAKNEIIDVGDEDKDGCGVGS